MASINTYLRFDGTCEEAFEFYRSILGGEFLTKSYFSEMPPEYPVADHEKTRVMHMTLPVGEHHMLFGSGTSESFGGAPVVGDNFSISYTADTEDKARRIFDELSEGGAVVMPMDKTFWNSLFGMLTDKFGISWMVSFELG